MSCKRAFDFDSGDTAVVLRHVAHGYGFAHSGACESAALEQIFVEPGYGCAAYAHDTERTRMVGIRSADGWSAVLASTRQSLNGSPFRFARLHAWADVEHRDGSCSVEGISIDEAWADEPGAASPTRANQRRRRAAPRRRSLASFQPNSPFDKLRTSSTD